MMLQQRFVVAALAIARLLPFSVAQTDDYERCLQAIKKADTSGNNRLNKDPEYVIFMQEITGDEFVLTSYDNLPETMQMNFEIYEIEGVIDVRGATRGVDATKRQIRVTETFCETTYLAIKAIPDDHPARTANVMNVTAFNTTTQPTSIQTSDSNSDPTDSSLTVSSIAPSTLSTVTLNSSSTTAPVASGFVSRNTTAPIPKPWPIANMSLAADPPIQNSTASPGATALPAPLNETSSPAASVTTPASIPVNDTSSGSPTTSNPTAGSDGTATSTPVNDTSTSAPTTSAPTEGSDGTATSTPANDTSTSPPTASASTAGSGGTATSFPVNDTSTSPPTLVAPTTGTNGTATVQPLSRPPDSPTAAPIIAPSNFTNDGEGSQELANRTNHPSAAPTTGDPFSDCKMVMAFADLDGDGAMNKIEYIWFLNDGWDNAYHGVAFKDLPQALRDNFLFHAVDGKINTTTMASGESGEQGLVDKFCNDTVVALAQEPESGAAVEEANMATFKECLTSVTLSDANSDSFVDKAEYVALINKLSIGNFGKNTFEDLPEVLQDNFNSLTDGETIDLGEEGSQQEILDAICVDTSYALHEASKDAGEEGPGFDTVDTDTMLEYAVCFMQMADHDRNNDLRLDEEEYVDLVNQMGKKRFQDMNFTELPEILQENFFNLEINGTINIEGSKPDHIPDTAQQHFLGRICIETTAAVSMELEFEDPNPSSSSTENSDGVEMGEPLVVHSSFNIYSDVLIPDHEFMMGATREVLQETYTEFVIEVFDGLAKENGRRNLLRRRLQEEDNEFLALLDRESPTVYQFVDLDCAGASQDAMCKTVFAQYEIIPILSMDRDALYEEYVRVTQTFIDGGLLQTVLERVDPDTLIAVIGASEPVVFGESTPTAAPTSSVPFYTNDDYEKEMSQSTKKTIALIAIAVGCLFLASLIGLIMVRVHKHQAAAAATAATSGDNATASSDRSMEKAASETASNKEDFLLEGSSQGGSSRGSHIFRSRRSSNGAGSDDDNFCDITDDDLGKMQVVDLCEGVSAAANNFEALGSKHLRGIAKQEEDERPSGGNRSSIPHLRRKKRNDNDDLTSTNSEEMSFAFRRYAIDGGDDGSREEI